MKKRLTKIKNLIKSYLPLRQEEFYDAVIEKHIQLYSRYISELLRFPFIPTNKLVEKLELNDHLAPELSSKSGISVIYTAHYVNYDFASVLIADSYFRPTYFVRKKTGNGLVDTILEKSRRKHRLNPINFKNAVRKVKHKETGIYVMPIDLPFSRNKSFNFLGGHRDFLDVALLNSLEDCSYFFLNIDRTHQGYDLSIKRLTGERPDEEAVKEIEGRLHQHPENWLWLLESQIKKS